MLPVYTCTGTRPRDQIVESNENGEHSLGRATEKESRARYYTKAGTNAIDKLTLGLQ